MSGKTSCYMIVGGLIRALVYVTKCMLFVSFRLAALEGHYDVVQILLSHGADIDSKDADGRSTLYVLALDNRLAMSKYFVQQGADIETRDLEVARS